VKFGDMKASVADPSDGSNARGRFTFSTEEIAGLDGAAEHFAGSALKEFRDKAERDFIIDSLKRNRGNISQAAVELGIGRSYLHRRLLLLKISKRDFLA